MSGSGQFRKLYISRGELGRHALCLDSSVSVFGRTINGLETAAVTTNPVMRSVQKLSATTLGRNKCAGRRSQLRLGVSVGSAERMVGRRRGANNINWTEQMVNHREA
jgi:hypothetical protein